MKPVLEIQCPICKTSNRRFVKIPTRWKAEIVAFTCERCVSSIQAKISPAPLATHPEEIEIRTMILKVSDEAQLKFQIFGGWTD